MLRARRDDLRMNVVVTNAEPLADHQRAVIAEAFHCAVRETYGMNENVAAASECEAGQLHLWPEVGIAETVDGEFICTGLVNTDMPLIRYRVGDRGGLGAATEPCACGRTLPVISSVDGRSSDLLITRDGRRVFWLSPVFHGLPVRESQIVQDARDRFTRLARNELIPPGRQFRSDQRRRGNGIQRDMPGRSQSIMQKKENP